MNEIKLYKTPSGWKAWHVGPYAARVREAFQTDILPTAFTAFAEADEVLAAMRRLNPGFEVRILNPVESRYLPRS